MEKLLYMPHAFFVNDHRQTYAELMHDEARERGGERERERKERGR